jgi:hypothetical protein
LPGGDYDLSVECRGSKYAPQKNVAVVEGQTRRFDIHLIEYQLDTLGRRDATSGCRF